ncbi:MAG: glycosyltransferase [Planctomycetes bacterium]|nr:glycosyltransferase [Planctomycetota bacterium]
MRRPLDYLVPGEDVRRALERWLRGLDVLLFVESPLIDGLTALAKERGVRIIAVPNWERLHPGMEWLDDVDGMLCPTLHTKRVLDDWKERFGFRWAAHYVPWPIDTERFPFRQRTASRRFLFINGGGGLEARRPDGSPAGFRRKGLEVLAEAARLVPHIPLIVRTQTDELPPLPENIEVRWAAEENDQLYDEGDVCVQPSHWEGLGLPLLECQAAGLPLLTLDAPPMNEHHPLAAIPVRRTEVVEASPLRPIAAPRPAAEDIAQALESLYGRDIAGASREAREYIQRRHSWRSQRANLWDFLRP